MTVSAVLVGRAADLSTASLVLDGAELPARIEKPNPRQWTIQATVPAGTGEYTARVSVRDEAGVAGGFTWKFTVGEPSPTPGEELTATPRPSPPPPTAAPTKPAAPAATATPKPASAGTVSKPKPDR